MRETRRHPLGDEMKPYRRGSLRAAIFIMPALAMLLAPFSGSAQDQASQGMEIGNYNVQQSLEFAG